jgi:large subunit ribosomal protein L15
MLLTDLRPNDGARKSKKRVGRGRASGHGKTSTRGHNGQGQRSGESKRFGFEGGQTPLFRRLPKLHNFNQVVNRHWVEVNVGALNGLPANAEIDADALVHHGVLRKTTDSLRILGNGELKVALKITAHHFSEGAKKKIEAAGGSITLIEVIPEEGKHSKRLQKSITKKQAELKAAEQEKAAAIQAKAEKKEKGAAKAPAKEKGAGGGGKPAGGKSGSDKGKPQQKKK